MTSALGKLRSIHLSYGGEGASGPLTAHFIHFFSDRPHRRSITPHSLDTSA